MKNVFETIQRAADFLKNKGWGDHDVAIILGTGLGVQFVSSVEVKKRVSYEEIPGFPLATVEYHKGELLSAHYSGKSILIFHGRFHYYEGYDSHEITFPVRLSKALASRFLLLSNAAGGVNLSLNKGDLMLIEDHINLQPMSPLRSLNDNRLGPVFVDMISPYSANLRSRLLQIAIDQNINLKAGVYTAVAGPNLETRAEYRYLRIIGTDAVGMSTVPEVIVANQIDLPCAAVSVITDECDPDNLSPVNIPEIMEIASKAEIPLTRLFLSLISELE